MDLLTFLMYDAVALYMQTALVKQGQFRKVMLLNHSLNNKPHKQNGRIVHTIVKTTAITCSILPIYKKTANRKLLCYRSATRVN